LHYHGPVNNFVLPVASCGHLLTWHLPESKITTTTF